MANQPKKRRVNDPAASEETPSSKESDNRKSAQVTRIPKACERCRKQKIRCIKYDKSNKCIRCSYLNELCSFESMPETVAGPGADLGGGLNEKLDRIYEGITQILAMMKGGHTIVDQDAQLLLEAASSMKKSVPESDIDEEAQFQSPATTLASSPFNLIKQQNFGQPPSPILNLLELSPVQKPSMYEVPDDVISLGILNDVEAIDLINDFRRNYGRWVSFPSSIPSGLLIERIRMRSSLLLTTCCCLSLRYSLNGEVSPGDLDNFKRKRRTYNQMMKHLVKDLNRSLLKYTSYRGTENDGDIEFLQALVIIAIYSYSLSLIVSNVDLEPDLEGLNLDPWFLSGFGLTTFITKTSLGLIFRSLPSTPSNHLLGVSPYNVLYEDADSEEHQTLTVLRIYNHLILVHLINCVFSGRMCVVDEIRLNYCTTTLSLASSTNFDGRMVSEIGILLIAYNYIQVNLNGNHTLNECEANYMTVEDEMALWYSQWEYLFNQPALQFVELCYDFCYAITCYTFNFQRAQITHKLAGSSLGDSNMEEVLKSADDRSLVTIVQRAYHLVRFIYLIENDSYFAYLSDQVLFCFYFAAVLLLQTLKHLIDSNNLRVLDLVNKQDPGLEVSSTAYPDIVRACQTLVEKFGRVGGANRDDIITKYKEGLTELVEKLGLT